MAVQPLTSGSQSAGPDQQTKMDGEPAVINLTVVRQRVGNDDELVRMLIKFFREDVPRLQQQIHEAATAQNTAEVQQLAHSLKGLASNLDAQMMMATTRLLERLDTPPRWDRVHRLLDDLDRQIREILEALQRSVPFSE